MNHKPVCIKCECEFQCESSGVYLLDWFLNNTKPYKLWHADLWECPKCHTQIIIGFGDSPLCHHFEEDRFQDSMDFARTQNLLYHSYERG